MNSKLHTLNTSQLRTLFLTQSKLFIKALDVTDGVDDYTRSIILQDLREGLKNILELIKEKEKEESGTD